MEKNEVIQALEIVIGTDKIEYISGTINNVGTNNCELSSKTGSVYGVAIELKEEELESFINDLKQDKRLKDNFKIKEWKPIGDNFYPLYWGKDINMRSRLYAHTKSINSTATLQLDDLKSLKNKKVIYGVIPCVGYSEYEKNIRLKYPDALKTQKGGNVIDIENIIGEDQK